MPLETGTRLGPYEVLESLPAAGGERYKATDTRSDRTVAITVLPPNVAVGTETRERLERDARTISSLERSRISGAIEVGHQEPSTDFVVAEFVDGETLASRLAAGPMDVADALEIAIRLAESLDQAHRSGLVHGGLSPSTIIMADDGPKILDFGVAGLLEESTIESHPVTDDMERQSGAFSAATTRTSWGSFSATPPANAAYMAPEQLAGEPPDPRSDIFSLGAVLYEMLTGKPAFEEKTPALLVAAIQTVEPEPVSKLQPLAPAALDHVVARCLAKAPGQRIQTARDLMRQLQWVGEGGSQVGIPVPIAERRRTHNRIVWAALAAGVLLAAILAPRASTVFGTADEPDAVRFTLPGFPTTLTGPPISLSPDGRWVTRWGAGLVGMRLDSVTPEVVVQTTIVVTQPFWSPDSTSIGFFEGGLLKAVDVVGGTPRTIAEAPPPIGSATWSSEGVILFASGSVIQRVLAAGSEPVPVTTLDEELGETEHFGPHFLPDGRSFIYTANSSDSGVYLATLDSPDRTRLFAAESKAIYAEPGYILFNRADTLFAQPFDADALSLTGEPIRVTDGLALIGPGAGGINSPSLTRSANFAVSQTGVLAFVWAGAAAAGDAGPAAPPRILEWRDRNGNVESVGPMEAYAGIDLSPDGTSFAAHVHEADGGDSWTLNFDQDRLQRYTFDAGQHNASPIWSPDGERIAFGSQRENGWGLYVKRADGSGEDELILETDLPAMPMSWSPDGSLLVYSQDTDVWAVGVDGDPEPLPILNAPYTEVFPTVSPAGGWMAYMSTETGQTEIYVKQFPDGPGQRQVSIDGGLYPRWRADGRELYYVNAGGILAVEIDIEGDSLQPGVPRPLLNLGGNPNPNPVGTHPDYHRFAVSADGERFLVSRNAAGGAAAGGDIDAQLGAAADGNAGNVAAGSPNTIIVNWPRMLEER